MRPPSLLRPSSRGGLWPLAFAAILAAAAWLPEAEAAKGVRRVRRKKVMTTAAPEVNKKEEVPTAGVPQELGGNGESAKQRNPEDGRGFLDAYYKQFTDRTGDTGGVSIGGSGGGRTDSDVAVALSTPLFPDAVPSASLAANGAAAAGISTLGRAIAGLNKSDSADVLNSFDPEAILTPELVREMEEFEARTTQNHQVHKQLLSGKLAAIEEMAHKQRQEHDDSDLKASSQSLQVEKRDDPNVLTSQFFESGYGESVASAPTAYHFTSPSSSFDSPTYNLAASSYDASLPTSYAQKSSDPVSRFFGVTTTQSNDLQLGLTFTVPFLSVPLSGLTSIFTGNKGSSISSTYGSSTSTSGLAGLTDLFNVNQSTIITAGVIIVACIFVLPQFIYWLTGINLSAFQWARSEDNPAMLNDLANTVDSALEKYDVDIRECVSHVVCRGLETKLGGPEGENMQLMSLGLANLAKKSSAVRTLIGDEKISEIDSVVASGKKTCAAVYPVARCPWSPNTFKKIAYNAILDSDLDLGTIMAFAAKGFVS